MKPKFVTSRSRDISNKIDLEDGILTVRAADQIRDSILSGDLKPGEHLGVSRTVVREAIKLLKASDLVRIRQGVGTLVCEPNKNIFQIPLSYSSQTGHKNFQDPLKTRELIEPAIAALTAQNASPEMILHLEEMLQVMQQNLSDAGKYVEFDRSFHLTLAQVANNSVFLLIVDTIVDLLQRSRLLAITSLGANARSNQLHIAIFEKV